MNSKLKLSEISSAIIFITLFLTAWIIFGFNTYNADYSAYEAVYYNSSLNVDYEIGYIIFSQIVSALGINFQGFRVLYGLIALVILFKSLYDYAGNMGVLAAYLLYPFLFDVTQVRIFMAEAIVIFSIRFLKEKNKKNVRNFIICIVIAMTFHTTAIVYFALALAYIKDTKKVLRISCIVVAFLLVINFGANQLLYVLISALSFLGTNWVNGLGYITFWSNLRTQMLLYLAIGIMICLVDYFKDKLCETYKLEKNSILLRKVLYVSMMYIPLIGFGPSFGRMFRCMLPVLYCTMAQGKIVRGWKLNVLNFACLLVAVALAALLFYSHIITGDQDTYNRVFRAILNNNQIFSFYIP